MIGTCTKCGQLYDFVSQEAAYEPDRLCRNCYATEWHTKNGGAIIQHSKDASGAAFLHYRGLGTFRVPANVQAELDAASEADLFEAVEVSGFIDPFVIAEVCNRGLYGAYQVWKAERTNATPPLGFGEAIINQLLAE